MFLWAEPHCVKHILVPPPNTPFLFKFIDPNVFTGTTWLQEIVWQIYHNGEISKEGIESRYPHFEKSQLFQRPGDESQVSLNSRPSPRLIKSHLPYHVIPISENEANRSKYLYIARNPKDATVSFYNFVRSFGPASYFNGTWEFFANLIVEGKGT